MKRVTLFKSGGSISLSSSPAADQAKDCKAKDKEARASGRQSIRGRISAPIPFLDPVVAASTTAAPAAPAPSVPAPAPVPVPAALPIASHIAVVSPLASPITESAPVNIDDALAVAAEAHPQAAPVENAAAPPDQADAGEPDPCDLETLDNAYDADQEVDDGDKGKAPAHDDEKDEARLREERDAREDDDVEMEMEMANSPEPMPPMHSQNLRMTSVSPVGHRRVQTLDDPKQPLAATARAPRMSQPPPPRQQPSPAQPHVQVETPPPTLGSPFGHRTNPSSTLRYSTASGASGTATSGDNTANSSPKPYRKKSTLRGALSKLFGRKKMGLHAYSHSQNPASSVYPKTDSYMPTIDDHYGDYEKELERAPNHRSVRSDPTVLSMAHGETKRSASASLPLSEYDCALRSHSVGADEMTVLDSARNSLSGDRDIMRDNSRDNRLTSFTNMSNPSHLSGLSSLSHVASLEGGRRRAATTTRVSLYPSPSLPLQARRRFGNNSTEVLSGSEWTGLSPRPASTHGRGMSRLSSHPNSLGHSFSASTSHAVPAPDAASASDTFHPGHLSHLSSNSISAKHDPSEIGRAITSDGPGADAEAMAHRRRSRSLSGLAEIAVDSVQARRRSDEIRYWRESYDPAYLSPLSSRHGDDDDEDYDGEDIHDEYTRPDYEGDDESEEDSDVEDDSHLHDDGGDGDDDDDKENAFQQRNSLSNVIHASKLQRILKAQQAQDEAQAQAQAQNESLLTPHAPAQDFPFATAAAAGSTRMPRPVSSHSVKAITNLSAQAAHSMSGPSADKGEARGKSDKDRNDARIGGLETRMHRMETVVGQLCHSVPGFRGAPPAPADAPRPAAAPTTSLPHAYATSQPAIPPIPAIYQSQVAPVQSSPSQYSVSHRSFDLEHDDELDESFGDGQTYIGSIPPSSSATQAPSMLVTSSAFFAAPSAHAGSSQQHHLVHQESAASLQTIHLQAQLESERAVRQTLETQVKKLNERVNMLSTTMYAMLRDPAAAAAASKSVAVKASPHSPQSPRRSPSSASVAASIAAAQLKADTVIQTAKALGHGTSPREISSSHTFSVESGGITPKGFIHDTSPSEYYYGSADNAENDENEDPIHDSDSKRRKAARTLSLGQLTLGKSAVQP